MLVGVIYGILQLISVPVAEKWGVAILVAPFSNEYAGYPIGMLLTAGTMVLVSLVYGWEASGALHSMDEDGWLSESRHQVQDLLSVKRPDAKGPLLWGSFVAIAGIILTLVVFW